MGSNKSGNGAETAWPLWLIRHLQNIGAMGNDRVGRRARPSRCRHCGWPILVGLDADRCAWVAEVDPLPLAPLGEALALLSGRTTYALFVGAGVCELQVRDRWQIEGSPAGTRNDVYAAHTCDAIRLPSAPSVNRLPEPLPAAPPY
jgi:hypothetical protein